MQKTTTSLNKTDLITNKELTINGQNLEPKAATLQKIMQFASMYRVKKISENQFIELFLN